MKLWRGIREARIECSGNGILKRENRRTRGEAAESSRTPASPRINLCTTRMPFSFMLVFKRAFEEVNKSARRHRFLFASSE